MKENFSDIVDIKFTADMESKLDLIKDGEEPWKEVIREFYGPFEKTLEKASESIEKVVIPDEVSDVKCEKCGSTLFRKGSKLYCAKEGCGFEMPVPKKD